MALDLGGIQVAEILHYFSDYAATCRFYADQLGWPVFYAAEGELLIIDVRNHYQLGLVNARWTPGWEKGQAVPPPQLSIECRDIRRAHTALADAGCQVSEVGGDPATMLTLELTDPWGNGVFFWQDASNSGQATGVEHEPIDAAKQLTGVRHGDSPYGFGEALYHVPDTAEAQAWYCEHLGFMLAAQHGEAYCALQIEGGRTLGLMRLADCFDEADQAETSLPPRLSLMVFDIAAEHARLSDTGVAVSELKDSGEGLRWFNCTDPDGVKIMFWQYEKA